LTELLAKSQSTSCNALCEINCAGVLTVRLQLCLNQSSEMIDVYATQRPLG